MFTGVETNNPINGSISAVTKTLDLFTSLGPSITYEMSTCKLVNPDLVRSDVSRTAASAFPSLLVTATTLAPSLAAEVNISFPLKSQPNSQYKQH